MAASSRKNPELIGTALAQSGLKLQTTGMKCFDHKNEDEKKWLIRVTNGQLLRRRRKTAEELIQSGKPLRQPPP